MDTFVEDLEIASARLSKVVDATTCSSHSSSEVVHSFSTHCSAVVDKFVAECREVRIVNEAVFAEPPRAKQWSYEWSDKTTDVDEYVEDLET